MRSKIAQSILDGTPEDVKLFVKWYGDILASISQNLEKKGISQKEFASKLGKAPSEVSKWLNEEHNFTLRSLAKIQAELGEEILVIPQLKPTPTFKSSNKVATFHVYINVADDQIKEKDEKWEHKSVQTSKKPCGNAG